MPSSGPQTAANVGYEAQLWQMANTLQGSIDAAEVKYVALGLTYLKHIANSGGACLRDSLRGQYSALPASGRPSDSP